MWVFMSSECLSLLYILYYIVCVCVCLILIVCIIIIIFFYIMLFVWIVKCVNVYMV